MSQLTENRKQDNEKGIGEKTLFELSGNNKYEKITYFKLFISFHMTFLNSRPHNANKNKKMLLSS